MGKIRRKPVTKKENETGNNRAFRYAVASMQGWRKTMEDSHRVSLSLPGEMRDWAFAGVFDGHGGKQVSEYTSKHLLKRILKRCSRNAAIEISQDPEEKHRRIKLSINQGFLRLDNKMQKTKKINDESGTTAVCVLVTPTHFYFANCGDSRAILCRDGKTAFATTDHTPLVKAEKMRILAAGGKVTRDRVNGCLALSRALGDFEYKTNEQKGQCDQMVSPQPDITVIERNENSDHFIILACDGVFEVLKNRELIDLVKNQMSKTKNLKTICNNVVDHCLKKGSHDNISIVLLSLSGCPSLGTMKRKRKLSFLNMHQAIHFKKAKVNNGNLGTLPPANSTENQQVAGSPIISNPVRGLSTVKHFGNSHHKRRRNCNPTNAFINYFLNYWKNHGGNVCKTAKVCGAKWTQLSRSTKQSYRNKNFSGHPVKQRLKRLKTSSRAVVS